jgi:predicted metal-dependent phosphoesterase TrpH
VDASEPRFQEAVQDLAAARERRLTSMLRALRRAGAPVSEEAVRARVRGPAPARPHVAAALVEAGHATSQQDAFDRWLKPQRPGFVPLDRIEAAEVISLARRAGGVTALAHPGLGVADDTLEALARGGVDALEVDHPAHSPDQRSRYRALARRLGLIPTAGSDFHGEGDRYARLGGETVPPEILTELEARRH